MNDKIKDLIDKAYKTDSIAKNKWRIENREQLREQRKKELKELMEKDKEMSNNKQSSVEWFLNELIKEGYIKRLPVTQLQQAKAMHKEEMINFTTDWYHNGLLSLGVLVSTSVEEHYNKTFDQ